MSIQAKNIEENFGNLKFGEIDNSKIEDFKESLKDILITNRFQKNYESFEFFDFFKDINKYYYFQ